MRWLEVNFIRMAFVHKCWTQKKNWIQKRIMTHMWITWDLHADGKWSEKQNQELI